jgi:hypothetical protein
MNFQELALKPLSKHDLFMLEMELMSNEHDIMMLEFSKELNKFNDLLDNLLDNNNDNN